MSESFLVVLVAGLTVFGLIYVAMEADIGPEDQPEEKIFLDKNIGTIGDVTEDFRTSQFGSFTVGEGPGEVQAYRSNSAELYRGLFSSQSVNFEYEASQPQDGELNFRVIGREGSGAVYVEVNGDRIFEEPMVSDFTGDGASVEIPEENLRVGENTFEIGTTRGSLLGATGYGLEDISAEINDRTFHDRTESLQMYTHELENFRAVDLTFGIPVDASIPEEPLEVRVNDNEVFSETVGQGEYNITLTPENADLTTGHNTLNFDTSGQSLYELENVNAQVRYGITGETGTHTEEIELSSSELDFVNQENTEESLEFDYMNLNNPNELQIDLNDETYELQPSNGENTIELDEGVLEEENILTLSSEGSFRMEKLQLISRQTSE